MVLNLYAGTVAHVTCNKSHSIKKIACLCFVHFYVSIHGDAMLNNYTLKQPTYDFHVVIMSTFRLSIMLLFTIKIPLLHLVGAL